MTVQHGLGVQSGCCRSAQRVRGDHGTGIVFAAVNAIRIRGDRIDAFDAIKGKGVDSIVCVSVNDAFVMDSWGQDKNAEALQIVPGEPLAQLRRLRFAHGQPLSTRILGRHRLDVLHRIQRTEQISERPF